MWTAERVARWQESGDQPSPVMCWTPAQLGQFLDAAHADIERIGAERKKGEAKPPQLYTLFHLIAHRGLRRGEACGLGWEDVDLDAGRITIRRQLVQLGWDVYEDAPKSDAGDRTIALDAGTVAVLRTHRARQAAARLRWGLAWVDSGKVFAREDGSALHPATVTDRFQALVAEAKLPPVRLHDLWHGAASLMLAAGVPAKVVQETLGHSNISLTLDTYTSVYSEVAAEAAAALVPRAAGTTAHTPLTHPASGESAEPRNPGQQVGRVGLEPTT